MNVKLNVNLKNEIEDLQEKYENIEHVISFATFSS